MRAPHLDATGVEPALPAEAAAAGGGVPVLGDGDAAQREQRQRRGAAGVTQRCVRHQLRAAKKGVCVCVSEVCVQEYQRLSV